MLAVIYARYSSHGQREQSIDDQVRACREAAEREGDKIVAVYADRARSGTSANRAEFLRMVSDAKSGDWQRVWMWKTDRFARNRYDAAIYKRVLAKSGVDLRYAAEQIPEGPMGVLVESLLDGLAEYYSANLSENVVRGQHGNAERCHPNGERRYGYRKCGARIEDGKFVPDDRYEVDESQAAAVRLVFAKRADGETLREIAEELNDLGFLNCAGNPFTKHSVRRMLHNEIYLGVYWYSDVRIEGGVPAIVTLDEWEAAHDADIRGQTKHSRHLHDITGMTFRGWTAVEHTRTDKRHRWVWLVRHECGYEREYYAFLLTEGKRPRCPVCDVREVDADGQG